MSSNPRPWWRRIVYWPYFCALALFHIVLLPLVLSEHEDDVVSIVVGVIYLALAAADLRSRRHQSGPAGR